MIVLEILTTLLYSLLISTSISVSTYLLLRGHTKKSIIRYANPRIASVITIKNDVVNQDLIDKLSKESDVYVLDDSDNPRQYNNAITISYKAKSKAEAINKFVKDYGDKYDFIGIFDYDSDVELPFYPEILKYFDDNTAFVQAKIKGKRGFLKELVEWYFDNRMKEPFLSMGHNVVFKSEVLRQYPLPEGMGEDFLYTFELWSKGYNSKLADLVITYENTPDDLLQFLKRDIKWSSLEFKYIKSIPKILKSKISIFKKIEVIFDVSRSIILLTIFFLMLYSIFTHQYLLILIGIISGIITIRAHPKSLILIPFMFNPILGLVLYFKYGISKEFIPTTKFKVPKYLLFFSVYLWIIIIIAFIISLY